MSNSKDIDYDIAERIAKKLQEPYRERLLELIPFVQACDAMGLTSAGALSLFLSVRTEEDRKLAIQELWNKHAPDAVKAQIENNLSKLLA